MQLNGRNWVAVTRAVHELFYIKNKTDDKELRDKCQNMIDVLFAKFPGLFPMNSESLSKQNSKTIDETSFGRYVRY